MNDHEYPVVGGRKDYWVLLALLLVSMVAWFAHQQSMSAAVDLEYRIRILTDPEQTLMFAVPQKNPLLVTGRQGPAEIEWDERGRVRIASSACRCQTCVNMGWTTNASLICVPNGIIVEAISATDKFDAVTR